MCYVFFVRSFNGLLSRESPCMFGQFCSCWRGEARNVLMVCRGCGVSVQFPLISRSGYLKRLLKDTKEVTLPSDCPGGPDVFELVANFCYGSTILMEPSNIAELRSVAEYLQMSEDYGRANLCERTDLYLTQVEILSLVHHRSFVLN